MLTQTTHLDFYSVVERHPDKKAIDLELRKLDRRLFLNAEMDPDFGMLVWSVCIHMGAGQEPVLVTDWRDPDTRKPLDLSWGIWSLIKARENRDPFALRDSIRADNAKVREMRAQRQADSYEEVVKMVMPSILGKSMPAFHRGQGLRRSRDRMRRLGLNV